MTHQSWYWNLRANSFCAYAVLCLRRGWPRLAAHWCSLAVRALDRGALARREGAA